jgi:hypothetical protein
MANLPNNTIITSDQEEEINVVQNTSENVQLILKSYLPVVYGTTLIQVCYSCIVWLILLFPIFVWFVDWLVNLVSWLLGWPASQLVYVSFWRVIAHCHSPSTKMSVAPNQCDSYWDAGQPNNHDTNEHCLEISGDRGYKWNDNGCEEHKFFICETP